MKRIDPNHNYFVSESGDVVRPLKPRVKGGVKYWNLVIDGRLKAFSEKTLKIMNLLPHGPEEKQG
jgi:hypothetical protein